MKYHLLALAALLMSVIAMPTPRPQGLKPPGGHPAAPVNPGPQNNRGATTVRESPPFQLFV